MARVYHLDIERKMLKGASLALLPGDPARVEKIASAVANLHGGRPVILASRREFTTYLAGPAEWKVAVTSTGIGGPSALIALEELARLGVRTFIRVGTSGALQGFVKNGDVVITTGSVRLDGASRDYAPIEYPAVATLEVVNALVRAAREEKIPFHTGITATSDTFYQGEERSDSFRKYTIRRIRGASEEWKRLGVLNCEMESAAILTAASSMGLEAGCVTGVINRCGRAGISKKNLKKGEENAITVAARALGYIMAERTR